jgi:hypothetical protein
MLEDVVTGALTSGVNVSTFVALNALLLGAVFSLAALLAVSLRSAPALAPHAAALLVLALGLWALIGWYVVAVVGFTAPEEQRRQLAAALGPDGAGPDGGDGREAAAGGGGGGGEPKKEQ